MVGVGFDFDHTLGLDNKLERVALLQLLGRERLAEGVDEAAAGKFIDDGLRSYRNGECSLETALDLMFFRTIGPAADTPTLRGRFYDETVAMAPRYVEALPGAVEVLTRLADAGIPTAILTNGWNPLQQRKADLIGYTGTVIVSDDIGIRKPDPRAFAALSATLALPPEQIFYVGDSPEADIKGALGAGMRAIWYDWENVSYNPDFPPPTSVIHALSELDSLVLAHPAWS